MCFLGWWSIIQNKLQQSKKIKKNKKLAHELVWARTQHHKGLFCLIPFVIVVYIFFIMIKSYFVCAYFCLSGASSI